MSNLSFRYIDTIASKEKDKSMGLLLYGQPGLGKRKRAKNYLHNTATTNPNYVQTSWILFLECSTHQHFWQTLERYTEGDNKPRVIITHSAALSDLQRIRLENNNVSLFHIQPQTMPESKLSYATIDAYRLLRGKLPAVNKNSSHDEKCVDGFSFRYTTPVVSSRPVFCDKRYLRSLDGYSPWKKEDYLEILWQSGIDFMHQTLDLRTCMKDYVHNFILQRLETRESNYNQALAWLHSQAHAQCTTDSSHTILERTARASGKRISQKTVRAYRKKLNDMWIFDPIPSIKELFDNLPSTVRYQTDAQNHLGTQWTTRLHPRAGIKHNIADPGLAAYLSGLHFDRVLTQDLPYAQLLFESFVALSLRVFLEGSGTKLYYYQARGSSLKVDFVVHFPDNTVALVDTHWGYGASPAAIKNLLHFQAISPWSVSQMVIVNCDHTAKRLSNGIVQVPLGLLGIVDSENKPHNSQLENNCLVSAASKK